MKKNLLFVMPSLSAGGGERSLINLLSQLDYRQYNVDLYLLSHEGLFMELIPEGVTLLPLPESYHRFSLQMKSSLVQLLRRRKLKQAFNRLMYTVTNQTIANVGVREQTSWKYLSPSLGKLSKSYHAAIGFLEKTAIYFCVDKVNAPIKLGWIHNDYDKLGMDPTFDRSYFDKLNHIVTVSEECANVLRERFPEQREKVHIIYNIVSPLLIRRMAELDANDLYGRDQNEFVILSIGRLHEQKGFELAILACRALIDRGYKVRWHVIGEGDERERLRDMIAKNRLERHFKLLGLKSNPYPYLQQADIYVQTSRFEGKSIAIDEAKILNKPIVITNFSTAKDQIDHGLEGYIVDMTADAIASAIGELLESQSLRERLSRYLSSLELGTETEINKLYQLLD
ncbi:glycosyltransferase [Paenibacillus sp. HB172176]|uniref:glycosyltransferase n=1 Tax=Paenibacillus sp. HB172176 TaxID=2493690 RepID=UPI00143A7D86|nr:glycosyltransferase [Paenibacillus sp. HB172176]